MSAVDPRTLKLRWLEGSALAGVFKHESTLYRRYWRSTTFSSVVEPTIYLLAFGTGFGSLVGRIGGYPYIEFLGTGVVASAVLFTSAFGAMFQTFVRRTFQHVYDALLAAPVDVHEVVIAEALWLALRAGVYGCAPMLVAIAFGLDPSVGMLLVPLVGFVTGLGFALFGIWMSSIVPSIDSFNYIISALLTPLFLVSGTFFPVTQLPSWAQPITLLNPLYHCVELVRHCVFLTLSLRDVGHLGALAVFVVAMGAFAIRGMRKQLID